MSDAARKLEFSTESVSSPPTIKPVLGLLLGFGILMTGWALSFPPIYYHLFVN